MAESKRLPAGQHTVVVGGTLRMKEFRQMVAAEKSGDLEQLYPWLVRLVQEWTVTDEAGQPLAVAGGRKDVVAPAGVTQGGRSRAGQAKAGQGGPPTPVSPRVASTAFTARGGPLGQRVEPAEDDQASANPSALADTAEPDRPDGPTS